MFGSLLLHIRGMFQQAERYLWWHSCQELECGSYPVEEIPLGVWGTKMKLKKTKIIQPTSYTYCIWRSGRCTRFIIPSKQRSGCERLGHCLPSRKAASDKASQPKDVVWSWFYIVSQLHMNAVYKHEFITTNVFRCKHGQSKDNQLLFFVVLALPPRVPTLFGHRAWS